MEIQQSYLYAQYIRKLGWTAKRVDGSYIFIRRFPIVGSLAKIQRIKKFPKLSILISLFVHYRVIRVSIEPDGAITHQQFSGWCKKISRSCTVYAPQFLPTKTILIDLTPEEKVVFGRFSEAKRRAVRRAQKNNVFIRQFQDINTFIKLKNKSAGFLGFITTYGLDRLWQVFAPNNATILLAYQEKQPVGGVLLLFWSKRAYYWIAAATKEGKHLFAPTLLVWEALRVAKKKGYQQFDFVGVWDERLPRQNNNWKGFTKFKEGFGGKSLYYPILH